MSKRKATEDPEMEADVPPEAPEETEVCAGEQQDSSTEEAPFATAPSGAVACRGLTTLSLDTPPLTVASAPEVDRSRSALELPVSCADAAPSDAACTLMPAMTAPPADEFAAAIAAANAVCFSPELTKVPHILGHDDIPIHLTDSASQFRMDVDCDDAPFELTELDHLALASRTTLARSH